MKFEFVEDPKNKRSCDKCCCNVSEDYCDTDKRAIAEHQQGKDCCKDKGYFVEEESE